jgi:hypothetical protein
MIGWKATSTDPRVASARIRCLNPLRELKRRGYPVELFAPTHTSQYDAVVYSKLYDQASYHEAVALKTGGVRVVLDLCDNHFYNPHGDPGLARAAEELRVMMDVADHLIASTQTLAGVMQTQLSVPRPISVIGDAVEDEIVELRGSVPGRWWDQLQLRRLTRWLAHGRRQGRSPLVWFGLHGGSRTEHGMLDLARVRPVLEALHRDTPLSLTVISNSRRKYAQSIQPWALPTAYLAWSPETFQAALRLHDIAIIPVTPNDFTVCKSNNRLVTALNSGLAVVADAIPSYREFEHVCRLGDWGEGLRCYLSEPHIRERDVLAGQQQIRRDWSLPRIADTWQRFFDRLLPADSTLRSDPPPR